MGRKILSAILAAMVVWPCLLNAAEGTFSTNSQLISGVRVLHGTGRDIAYITFPTFFAYVVGSCTQATFSFDVTTPVGQALYASSLTAYIQSKPVWIQLADSSANSICTWGRSIVSISIGVR